MSIDKDLFEILRTVQAIREYHHDALWEEEKHFTWLLSILLTAIVGVFVVGNLDLLTKSVVIAAFSLLGVILSAFAFRVVRREGDYFHQANRRFVLIHKTCFPEIEISPVPNEANKRLFSLLWSAFTFKAGVRDVFQLVFVVFSMFFVLIGATAFCTAVGY